MKWFSKNSLVSKVSKVQLLHLRFFFTWYLTTSCGPSCPCTWVLIKDFQSRLVNKYNATAGFSLLKMKSLTSQKQEEPEIIEFSGEKERIMLNSVCGSSPLRQINTQKQNGTKCLYSQPLSIYLFFVSNFQWRRYILINILKIMIKK